MDLYDDFIPSERIVCPLCKKEIENADSNLPFRCVLQSNALERALNTYKQGELLEIKGIDKKFSIKDGWIEAHTVCDKCDSYVRFKLIIKNGAWIRTEKWKEDVESNGL